MKIKTRKQNKTPNSHKAIIQHVCFILEKGKREAALSETQGTFCLEIWQNPGKVYSHSKSKLESGTEYPCYKPTKIP